MSLKSIYECNTCVDTHISENKSCEINCLTNLIIGLNYKNFCEGGP